MMPSSSVILWEIKSTLSSLLCRDCSLVTGDTFYSRGLVIIQDAGAKQPELSRTDLVSSLGPQSVKERLRSELPGTSRCVLSSECPCEE